MNEVFGDDVNRNINDDNDDINDGVDDEYDIGVREGVQKNRLFLGNSPKQRTPPAHR